MARKKSKPPGSLSKGRPPTTQPPARSMSRKAGRALINTHHTLEKQRKQAAARGDGEAEKELAAQITALGGLEQYQQASLQGQRRDRGGDTSKVLLEWLQPALQRPGDADGPRLRMLEVGALSTQNACSASGYFDMELIDLNSQEPGIVQQDFMQRPLPPPGPGETGSDPAPDRFDVISLSLVLNFVPDPRERGEMLRRTLVFLRSAHHRQHSENAPFPCVFVVLPRSCVSNSRYFSDDRFRDLMTALGFEHVKTKLTEKLAYYLWRKGAVAHEASEGLSQAFPRREINPGRTRNNFAIILEQRGTPWIDRRDNHNSGTKN